ncbi:MAG: ribokinase [Candidatus Hermodarchaeota archaeon]
MIDLKNYVIVIGSSNMDFNIYSERLPKPGETVTGGKFKQSLGGKGANQSVASVRSGSDTVFISKVGRDIVGDQMILQLKNKGVNTDYILKDLEESSGIAFIMIDKDGENMISVAPGANTKLVPEEIRKQADLIKASKSLIVQMEISIETIKEVFSIASKGDVIKILNPAPLKYIPKEILKNIDIIVPNEGELIRLNSLLGFQITQHSGEETIIQISRNISSLGVKNVITTLGSKGSLTYQSEKDEWTKIPAFKVQAVDTVGAGDCFNGVLASKLNQGEDLITSVKYATAAASIAVTRKGAQKSIPYLYEIEKKYMEFSKLS